ncbi:hypothetical protein ACN42_g5196 [Penicillium freii]|uniref:Uncharacterized protein n=1 Tax=Penicillium freii TaxID=48697 RepID=A0A101MJW4_PENFR|nr:hypothetical protein ACN42_g5196 [Penicillium freii]
MASGLFFDPLKLLRVAPLLTTTSALLYAWDEHWYLSGFLRSEHKSETETILPSYFRRFFEQGVFIIAGLNTLTVSTSVANLLIDRPVLDRLRSSRWNDLVHYLRHNHQIYKPNFVFKQNNQDPGLGSWCML